MLFKLRVRLILLLPSLLTAPIHVLSQSQCQLCPIGSEMGRPDKMVVGTEQFSSCSAIDTLLASVSTEACEIVLRELNQAPVDFREYCECSGYTQGPNFCSLCGNDLLIKNVNESQPLLGGYTCGQYHDLASAAQTLAYCETLQMGQAVCCEDTRDPTDTCHVCGEGLSMTKPERRIMLLADNVTCENYERELETYAQYPNCDGLPGFDFASYCHCEGSSPPQACHFCNGGEVTNPSLEVYVDGLDVWMTCEEVALASVHTSNAHLCSLLNSYSYECCGVTATPVQPSRCGVCSSDALITLPDRELIARFDIHGKSLTCGSFDQYIVNESVEVCESILEEEIIALSSYCGCSDAPTFPNVCRPMCTGWKVLLDPSINITLHDVNVTCGQADILNSYFVEEEFCADNFPILEETCCGDPIPATSEMHSTHPTNASNPGTDETDVTDEESNADDWVKNHVKHPFLPHDLASKFWPNETEGSPEYGLKGSAKAAASDGFLSQTTLVIWFVQLGALGILLR